MKKIFCILTLALTMGSSFNAVMAAPKPKDKTELTSTQKAQLDKIIKRVDEIREMDKSELSRVEKKELRSELRDMKTQARALSGGVYLSVGAIIIIILLLILIL